MTRLARVAQVEHDMTRTDPSTVGENWPADARTVARAFDAYSVSVTDRDVLQHRWEAFCREAPEDDAECVAWLRRLAAEARRSRSRRDG